MRRASGSRSSRVRDHVHGPRHRVPDQRGGSGNVRAVAGHDPRLQRAGRPGRAHRYGGAHRVHHSAVLRLDDCQGDRPRPRSAGSHRADAPRARDDGHRRHQDHDSSPPQDPRRTRLRGRPPEHVVHGSVPAAGPDRAIACAKPCDASPAVRGHRRRCRRRARLDGRRSGARVSGRWRDVPPVAREGADIPVDARGRRCHGGDGR